MGFRLSRRAIDFGDAEPEDAWHPDDSIVEQVENLIRRAELLLGHRLTRPGTDPESVLHALAHVVVRVRRRRPHGRELLRVDQLDEDIEYVRSRL